MLATRPADWRGREKWFRRHGVEAGGGGKSHAESSMATLKAAEFVWSNAVSVPHGRRKP
jgi:hypothetical protein